jgi:PAS domain S-box-containing protein
MVFILQRTICYLVVNYLKLFLSFSFKPLITTLLLTMPSERALIDFDSYSRKHDDNLICLHEAKGTYLHVSENARTLTGYDADELIGKNPYDYFHPEDQHILQNNAHLPVLEGKEDATVELRFRKKDGEYLWLRCTVLPIRDQNGTIFQLLTISKNINTEHDMKEDAELKEMLFEQISSLAKIGTWEIDLEHDNFPVWSKSTYDIHELGYDAPIADLDYGFNFYPGETQALLRKHFYDAVEKGIPYDLTVPFITAKGHNIWVRTVGKPLISLGKTVKVFGVIQNVTDDVEERVKLQELVEELTEKNKQLEGLLQSLPLIF